MSHYQGRVLQATRPFFVDFPKPLNIIEHVGTDINSTLPQATVGTSDYVAHQNANQASDGLHNGSVYDGEVLSVDYTTRKLVVSVNGLPVQDCIYATACAAGILGFADASLPPVGAHVVCLYTNHTTYVIGVQPAVSVDPKEYTAVISGDNSFVQADELPANPNLDGDPGKGKMGPGFGMSRDLLPGEFEYSNNMGVVLRLLTNLIQLDAGGRAGVELHLANDMLRLFDQTFVHHTCGGDRIVWNNGRCNDESHFTQYPSEAAGKLSDDAPYAETESGVENVYKLPKGVDPVDATGRWRWSRYRGFLGDMVHYWVTHPSEVVSNYAEGAARAGRFKTWVGSDGTLVVQAAGDVLINVNPHIVIPEALHKWDNPEWEPEKMLEALDKEYLAIWGTGDKRWDDLNASVWQMRSYLKYLTLWHSMARFRQLSTDKAKLFKIPSEKDAPLGNTDCGETDRREAGATSEESPAASATLRMSPDGSITLVAMPEHPEKTGISSVVMNNGSIQIVAPRNIEIKAGATFSVTARDISMRALKLVEIASIAGAMALKARTAWKALCEAGRVWLKGDRNKDNAPPGNCEMPPEFLEYSVIVDASQGKSLVHGREGVTVGTTGADADVHIEALNGTGSVYVYGHGIYNKAVDRMETNAPRYAVSSVVSKLDTSMFKLGDSVRVADKGLVDISPTVRCNALYTSMTFAMDGYIGPDEHNGVYDKDDPPENTRPDMEAEDCDTIGDEAGALSKKDMVDDYPQLEFKGGKTLWELYDWERHNEIDDPESIKADMWFDDVVVVDGARDEQVNKSAGRTLLWPETRLQPAERTGTSRFLWPGAGATMLAFKAKGEPRSVWQPMEEDFTKDKIASASDMKPRQLTYIFYDGNDEE